MQRRGQYLRYINDIRAKQVLGKNKRLELYSPGGICRLCRDIQEELQHCSCNGASKCGVYYEECWLDMKALEKFKCEKAAVYEFSEQGWWLGRRKFLQGIMKDITRIRSHVYEEKSKLIKGAKIYP